MSLRPIGVSFALAACSLVAFACGGSTSIDDGSPVAGSTCDRLFLAYERVFPCEGRTLPASELARIRPRFDASCGAEQTLPGSGFTDTNLDACTEALAGWTCNDSFPLACEFIDGS